MVIAQVIAVVILPVPEAVLGAAQTLRHRPVRAPATVIVATQEHSGAVADHARPTEL